MILFVETFSIRSSYRSIVQHCCCHCSFFHVRNRKEIWTFLSIGSHPITFWLLKFQSNNFCYCLWFHIYPFSKWVFFPSSLWTILKAKPTKFTAENFKIYKVFRFDSYRGRQIWEHWQTIKCCIDKQIAAIACLLEHSHSAAVIQMGISSKFPCEKCPSQMFFPGIFILFNDELVVFFRFSSAQYQISWKNVGFYRIDVSPLSGWHHNYKL